ncbi:mechanosensitive ion channel domain-containing protein [Nitrincola tapanii]|uniref:Mechanosensitive ion channel n=1 Tax=Nitrincola tapanii TaxID=1708751 RepID=A0A5A9W7Q7_9GAMM|nr:mechanosensitive ion channel domain-containing protein [Nitrincola tapanii]KAA0875491.1 mechanosensitive ion channel [Nitrincola tapanii]
MSFRSCAIFCLLSLTLIFVSTSFAAVTSSGRAPVSVGVEALQDGREQVQQQLQRVDPSPLLSWQEASALASWQSMLAQESLAEGERAFWQAAQDAEQTAQERVQGALDRWQQAQEADARFAELLERLQALETEEVMADEAEPLALSQLEAVVSETRLTLGRLRTELEQNAQAQNRLEEQQRNQPETLERFTRELADAQVSERPELTAQEELAWQAREEALIRQRQARVLVAQLDLQLLPARISILRLQQRFLEWEQALHQMRLQRLEVELSDRSNEELRQFSAQLQTLLEREPDLENVYAAQVTSLRARMDAIASAYAQSLVLQANRDTYARLETRLSQSLQSVQERLEVSGLTEALGVQFLEERKRLHELNDQRFALPDLERELAQARLRVIAVRDQQRQHQEAIAQETDPLLQPLQRLTSQIITAQLASEEQLTELLRQNEVRLRSVSDLARRLDQTLNESLLWWPSHSPISLSWLAQVPAATVLLLTASEWGAVTQVMALVTLQTSVQLLILALFIAALYMAGRRAPGILEELAEQASHRFTDNMGLTLRAISWSLLRVAPIPLLLWIMAWRLEGVADTSQVAISLSNVMYNAATWWFFGHLLHLFTRETGVGVSHFDWNPVFARRIRIELIWFLPVQLLLILFLALVFNHPDERVYDVYGRLALGLVTCLNAVLAWRLLAPDQSADSGFFHTTQRKFLRLGATGIFVLLLLLVVAGYLLTVGELLPRVVDTLVMMVVVWLGYSLAARALILSETHLRIRRMREQRAKAAEESGNTGAEGGVELPDQHLSIEHINLQTRTLLRTTVVSSFLVALFLVWASVLPALTWLDGVTLWSRAIQVGDAEILSRVSLQDFLLALFLGGVFTLAARNLPGLVEILLARSKMMDAAHSYTVTTLMRYALTVVAVITVFSLLGLRWSELQWMVAALTLGLGFGLQEVVANFVSGVIMLFERPVRVGDTISIGEYSGTVSKIRTRATTIIDWDNREVVVPNKNFITERLINWTLSDNITRIVIPIGVSYSSDPEQVMEILLQIAREHPLTLDEPGPSAYFVRFADSTLNFELRVYVDQMKDRLVTTSALNVQILKAFREKGIEIAFPQMDLHIRDLPTSRPEVELPALR